MNNKIVGYEKEKNELKQLQHFLLNLDKYKQTGIRIPRGLILHGAPGVGKTSLAKSIICNGINLIEVRAADCSEDNVSLMIQSAFNKAIENAPSVVLLDEFDKIAGSSSNYYMEENETVSKILLQELDILAENDGVLVVATCNDLECLSDSLLRSGRFDRILHIPKPSKQDRKMILEEYFSRIALKKTFEMDNVVQLTGNYTGAELESIVNECGIMATVESSPITIDIVRRVINKMNFKSAEGVPTEDSDQLYKIAIHEAGHILVALFTMADSIYGASLYPQGESIGHIQLAGNENSIPSIKDMENKIALALAGRISEREILQESLLGSSADIRKASVMAYNLVTRHLAYGGYKCAAILSPAHMNSCSENLLNEIENQITQLMERLDTFVTDLIKSNNDLLEKIAKELMDKKVLNRDDLLSLLDKKETIAA